MRDEKNELLMISNGVGCFFNFYVGKAVKLPDNIGDYLAFEPAEEMEALPRKIALPCGTGIPLEPFKVMRSDLDMNRHLTSAKYLGLTEDRLPDGFTYNRVRIEFKHQVRLGETVRPFLYRESPDSLTMQLKNSEGLLNALVEFSSMPGRRD